MDPLFHLTCGCCGYSDDLTLPEAFDQGWDTADRFGYTACPLCPGVFVYFPLFYLQESRNPRNTGIDRPTSEQFIKMAARYTHAHAKAHERWAREGRPEDYMSSVERGDVPGETPEHLQQLMDAVKGASSIDEIVDRISEAS